MPLVSFHGTGDGVNPYDGGGSPYWTYSIPTALQRWAELGHCESKPREQHIALHVTLLRYKRCAQGVELWLYRTEAPSEQGGGHAWPGAVISAASASPDALRANKPSTEISASELMWQFFKHYSLPAAFGK
jgi:polyhydroxybutyrate depolymerase